jgi:hypothetical protein
MQSLAAWLALTMTSSILSAQPRTDAHLENILSANTDPLFLRVLSDPLQYRLQIIYTQIDRDKNNRPTFTHFYFHYDPAMYFNPASMVKMPLAFLALEKLNRIGKKNVTRDTRMVFEQSRPWQTALSEDSTAATGFPSIGHFIKRALLISENDPYNRFYQFLGQGQINRRLREMGYTDARITRQFLGLTAEQNRHTNALSFLGNNGEILYHQPPAYNTDSFDFSRKILLGNAHLDREDKLVPAPFDFTEHNNLSLSSLQQMLQSVLFPRSVAAKKRFALTPADYRFLHRYLSQYPSETPDPLYDEKKYYDSYVKFFFRDSSGKMASDLRVFNKVGWSYGFVTDVSYVADYKNKVEFMLAATLYVNSDGVLNDNKYEYDQVGYPFLYQLGQTIYRHELARERKRLPNLEPMRVSYESRKPGESRAPIREVDN